MALLSLARRQISEALDSAPVDVSAWTKPTIFTLGLDLSAFSTLFGSTALPQSSSVIITFAPARLATSAILVPNTPLIAIITSSPGSIMLFTQASIPNEPGPETGKVILLLV